MAVRYANSKTFPNVNSYDESTGSFHSSGTTDDIDLSELPIYDADGNPIG